MVPEASKPQAERRAIESVLEAERRAEEAVAKAHHRASAILAAARERCQRIHALADQRIACIHSRCADNTDRAIEDLKREHAKQKSALLASVASPERIDAAAFRVAGWLLGFEQDETDVEQGAA